MAQAARRRWVLVLFAILLAASGLAVAAGPSGASPSAPGAPSNVRAGEGNGAATVAWGAAADGGSPITSYAVTTFVNTSTPEAPTWVQQGAPLPVQCGAQPCLSVVVTGLAHGSTYMFEVTATNAVGTGPLSAPSNAVKIIVPLLVPPFSVPTSGSNPGKVVDGNGDPVVLKGVTRDGPEMVKLTASSATLPKLPELQHLAAWGANMLRVDLSEDLWNQSCQSESLQYDGSYQSDLHTLVDQAAALHMLVVLTLNFTNPNCAYNKATAPQQNAGGLAMPLPGTGAIAFWQDLAGAFGGNPWVAFEPYNEPHVCAGTLGVAAASFKSNCVPPDDPANDDVWANGGTVNDNNTVYQAVGMVTMYNTIRERTNNLVFVDPNVYATDPGSLGAFTTGTNVVWGAHYYPCSAESCAQPNAQTGAPPAAETCSSVVNHIGFWLNDPDVSGKAVVWNEFGWPNALDTFHPNEIDNVVSYLSSLDQGWAAFAWSGSTYDTFTSPWALLKTTTPAPDDADATNTGWSVKQALQGTPQYTCAAPVAPEPPTNVDLKPGNEGKVNPASPTVTVKWMTSLAQALVTKYKIDVQQYHPCPACNPWYETIFDGTFEVAGSSNVPPVTSRTFVVPRALDPTQVYRVSVRAVGTAGESAPTYPPQNQWQTRPA